MNNPPKKNAKDKEVHMKKLSIFTNSSVSDYSKRMRTGETSPYVEKEKKKVVHFRGESNSYFIEQNSQKKLLRLDIYGTEINKKNRKKVKITFKDTLPEESLIEVIKVESWKKYNEVEMPSREDKYYRETATCCSCLMF